MNKSAPSCNDNYVGREEGKTTNTDNGINAESKFRANKFLRVHLQILKALYEEERMAPSISGDSRVEEIYWGIMETFLVERNTLRRTTKRAERMLEIYDEAMEFQKRAPSFSMVNNHMLSPQFSPQFKRHGYGSHDSKGQRSNFKFGMLITQPSPHYLPNRTPRGWSTKSYQSASRRNPIRSMDEAQCDAMENGGGNVFGMVSGLLKRKHNLASRHLNRRTSKLQALVKESQSRIETLNSELTTEKEREKVVNSQVNIEDFMLAKEEREDRRVRIETKIRLWKLLLHDLLGTISVQT